jgi:hypothetical protein
MCDIKKNKGMSLVLVMLITTIVLGIALGISSILFTQIRILREIGYSVVAFYAADTGIERILLSSPPENISETVLGNGATFTVEVTAGGAGNCDVSYSYCIKSVGEYQSVKRAIQIVY